jgi:hypothetical protein
MAKRIYYTPAVVVGGTPYFLPPWVDVEITRSQRVSMVSPPRTGNAVITSVSKNAGARISITAAGVPDAQSQAAVLAWLNQVWEALSGEDKTFDLFIYSHEAWAGCALESQSESYGTKLMLAIEDLRLDIICPNDAPDPTRQLNFTNFNAEYPFADVVGRPLGDADEPEVPTIIMQPSIQNISGIFAGQHFDAGGSTFKFIVGGNAGSRWKLGSLAITSAENFDASDSSKVKISVGEYEDDETGIEAEISETQTSSGRVTGNIEVTAGDSLFVFLTKANGHSNIQFHAELIAK